MGARDPSSQGRLDKLGVKPDLAVRITGQAPADFLSELAARGCRMESRNGELHFLFAESKAGLKKLRETAVPLWIVYPKGRAEITENQVLEAGRSAGLVDVKVVSFSGTHTGLKFVRPRSLR